jgi:hypothetical protein
MQNAIFGSYGAQVGRPARDNKKLASARSKQPNEKTKTLKKAKLHDRNGVNTAP